MSLPKFSIVLTACLSLCGSLYAQDVSVKQFSDSSVASEMSKTVIPLSELQFDLHPHLRRGASFYPGLPAGIEPGPGFGVKRATAFCLDPECSFVATNYHVAAVMRLKKIKGWPVAGRYLDTGPQDHEATVNRTGTGPMAFNTSRDIAIFRLNNPLPKHHGLAFSCDELRSGQRVDIWGYPVEKQYSLRKLRRFPATFRGKADDGTLLFDYQLVDGKAIKGGASGGIVIDSETHKIVGILNRAITATGLRVTAVPTEVLAEFVRTIDPFLGARLFPSEDTEISSLSDDFYPEWIPSHVSALQHRQAEPDAINLLRANAQKLTDSLKNYVAIQTVAWGQGDHSPDVQAEFEIQDLNGTQTYRRYPDGKKEITDSPTPPGAFGLGMKGWVATSGEWLSLPDFVGKELKLYVNQAPDVVASGRQMKVFQYYASVEDNECPFEPTDDYPFFRIGKVVPVACYGEVWTDKDTNILRISRRLDLSKQLKAYKGWFEYQTVVNYGWVKDGDVSRWVPSTFLIKGRHKKDKEIYWCRGQFTNYKEFSSKARLVAAQ